MAKLLQQVHQMTRKIIVEVLNGAFKILATDHLVNMIKHNLRGTRINNCPWWSTMWGGEGKGIGKHSKKTIQPNEFDWSCQSILRKDFTPEGDEIERFGELESHR